jgi:predicted lactoylglutathione lyase
MKTHISLNVSDIGQSIEFYRKMFAAEPFKVKPDYAKFDIADPPLNLTMNQSDFEKGGSISHLGLQVDSTEEVLEIGRRWAEAGLGTFDEMKTECCYALQDKIWVADPDGNRWEVFAVLENTEGMENAASVCCAPTAKTVSITGSKQVTCC